MSFLFRILPFMFFCQFKHGISFEDNSAEEVEVVNNESNQEDNDESEYECEDETMTDDEETDFEPVQQHEIEQNHEKDCGGCGKDLHVKNSYKCIKCGGISHRSKCNTLFDHIKKIIFVVGMFMILN